MEHSGAFLCTFFKFSIKSFSSSLHIPWLRRTLIAYRDCPHLQTASRTCLLMDKWLVTVIARILICVTRWMSSNVGRYYAWDLRLRSWKIISMTWHDSVFLWAHSATCPSSVYLSITGRDNTVSIVGILVHGVSWRHSGQIWCLVMHWWHRILGLLPTLDYACRDVWC